MEAHLSTNEAESNETTSYLHLRMGDSDRLLIHPQVNKKLKITNNTIKFRRPLVSFVCVRFFWLIGTHLVLIAIYRRPWNLSERYEIHENEHEFIIITTNSHQIN